MKIFAFNFALNLLLPEAGGHFHFRTESLKDFSRQLEKGGPGFPGQTRYFNADPSNLDQALKTLLNEAIAPHRSEAGLYFQDKKSRKAFLKRIKKACTPEPAAGGLVQNESGDLLLIFRNGMWDLPKGKIEKGEANSVAAWREVAEETGLQTHQNGEKYGKTFHVYFRKGKWRFKTTHWYWMTQAGAPKLMPQTEEGITEVRWWPLSELRASIPRTYPQIEELIAGVLQHQPQLP